MQNPEADAGDAFARDLQALTDQERRDAAARNRRQRHWMTEASRESGTLLGILADLGERGITVTVALPGRRHVRGLIVELATDCLVLELDTGRCQIVALRSIGSVRGEPTTRALAGDREVTSNRSLGEVLSGHLVPGTAVTLTTCADEQWQGSLHHLGVDVLALIVGAGTPTYVPLAQICDLHPA